MFEGFVQATIDTGEAQIEVRHGGSGPPVLLLHGSPETHAMWHKVAAGLARDFTIVAADLRGYGDSSKPPSAGVKHRSFGPAWPRRHRPWSTCRCC
jgi:haloacetate dehalogenase